MKRIILLVFCLGLISCSVNSPKPTPTPVTVDLTSLKLDSILIKPEDLPAGFSGGQVSIGSIPSFFGSNMPVPQNQIIQEILSNGKTQGSISVWLFLKESDAKMLYNKFVESFGNKVTINSYKTKNGADIQVAEYSMGNTETGITKTFALTFTKCQYIGYLMVGGIDQEQITVNYIERLSTRLDNLLICN